MGKLLFCSSFKLLPFPIKQKPSLTDSVVALAALSTVNPKPFRSRDHDLAMAVAFNLATSACARTI
jgi:hypothetical protein